MSWHVQVGRKFRVARYLRGETIDEVAQNVRMSPRTVGEVERGNIPGVTADTIFRLAEYHGMKISIDKEQIPTCGIDKTA